MATNTSSANDIRKFTRDHYILPAKKRGDGSVSIRVGDVHREMKLTSRVPAVCQALGSKIFLAENDLKLESRQGPPSGQSPTVVFTYRWGPGEPPGLPTSLFERMRGLAKDLFPSANEWEESVRRDRESFYRREEQS
jgi:5-methylcytosine-specific restriction protein B